MSFSFQILTYGCKVNQYESQAIREYWQSLGAREILEKGEIPDLVLLAGCAVTAQAVADARQMVRKLLREMPQTKVLVTGCSASAEPKDFSFENVLAIVPQTAKWNLLHYHPFSLPKELMEKNTEYPDFAIKNFARSRPVLKIQDGCSHFCSYCIIPYMRGKARSRSIQESLAELRHLLEAGFREIMISGINLRQYFSRNSLGDKQNFWGFLRLVEKEFGAEWKGRARLRISSLEPAQLNDEGLETLEQCSLLCPHLHLSLQSGSASVLQRMGREHYTPEYMVEQINKIKMFWQTFGLGADFLMGFPGETDKEVAETLALVDALPFTYAHVFPFSVRKDTKAETLPNQLEKHVKQEHAQKVRAKVEEKKLQFLQTMLEKEQMYLSLDMGTNEGWNEFYVACHLENAPNTHELLTVKPHHMESNTLFVEQI